MSTKKRSRNDQRSDVKNKNNREFKLDELNRIRQKQDKS